MRQGGAEVDHAPPNDEAADGPRGDGHADTAKQGAQKKIVHQSASKGTGAPATSCW